MTSVKIGIIVGSTRPGRHSRAVADWVLGQASGRSSASYEIVDLVDYSLPHFDEAMPPSFGQYEHDHTKEWSARVDAADAFVFVMAEYNHSFTAPIKNAVDFLNREWAYKAVAFVGYGGVAGGTRAVQAIKPVCIAVRLIPLFDSVYIPWIAQQIDEEGAFTSTDALDASASVMLDELVKMTEVLRPLRRPDRAP